MLLDSSRWGLKTEVGLFSPGLLETELVLDHVAFQAISKISLFIATKNLPCHQHMLEFIITSNGLRLKIYVAPYMPSELSNILPLRLWRNDWPLSPPNILPPKSISLKLSLTTMFLASDSLECRSSLIMYRSKTSRS